MKHCFECTQYVIREDYIEGWGYQCNSYCMLFDEVVEGLGSKAETCTEYHDSANQEFRMKEEIEDE